MKDDLISRKAVRDGMMKYGFVAPDMTVHEFVEDELPSVPAVPLEPLAKWITENLDPRYRDCEHCSEENACFDCPIMTEQQVKEKLGKWMEEQDAAD